MAVNQVVETTVVEATDKQSKEPAVQRGDKTRKNLKAAAAAAETITDEINNEPVVDDKAKKPAAEAKLEDEGKDDFKTAFAEKQKKEIADARAELKKEREELEKAKAAPKTEVVEAKKFELPKFEMPDLDSIKEEEDFVPHVKKAFESLHKWASDAIGKLVEQIEELGGEVGEVADYAEKMSASRTKRVNAAFTTAIEEAKAEIDEMFEIDELPESISKSFIKLWKGGVIEFDPNDELPTKAMLIKAWKTDNADLLEKFKPNAETSNGKEKKKPVIAKSAGAGDGTAGLTGRDRVKARLRQDMPGQFD